MILFDLKVNGDILALENKTKLHTGNVNSYKCQFTFDAVWNDYLPAKAVFCINNKSYTQDIVDGACFIPYEALEKDNTYISIGVFAYANNKIDILSTGMIKVYIEEGAYRKGETPATPTKDEFQTYTDILKNMPYIGDNGNWYVYDVQAKAYTDSGVPAQGVQGEKVKQMFLAILYYMKKLPKKKLRLYQKKI